MSTNNVEEAAEEDRTAEVSVNEEEKQDPIKSEVDTESVKTEVDNDPVKTEVDDEPMEKGTLEENESPIKRTEPNCRNPITGTGLEIKNLKTRINMQRGGNPVTGEGYASADPEKSAPRMNGVNDKINKNQVPPGGYSSGLW